MFFSERLDVDECLDHKWLTMSSCLSSKVPIENGNSSPLSPVSDRCTSPITNNDHQDLTTDRVNENNETNKPTTPLVSRHPVVPHLNGTTPNGKTTNNGHLSDEIHDKENLHNGTTIRTNGHLNVVCEASVFPDAPTTPKVIRKIPPLYSSLRKTTTTPSTVPEEINGCNPCSPVVIVQQQPLSAENLTEDQVLNSRNMNGCQQRICSPD